MGGVIYDVYKGASFRPHEVNGHFMIEDNLLRWQERSEWEEFRGSIFYMLFMLLSRCLPSSTAFLLPQVVWLSLWLCIIDTQWVA